MFKFALTSPCIEIRHISKMYMTSTTILSEQNITSKTSCVICVVLHCAVLLEMFFGRWTDATQNQFLQHKNKTVLLLNLIWQTQTFGLLEFWGSHLNPLGVGQFNVHILITRSQKTQYDRTPSHYYQRPNEIAVKWKNITWLMSKNTCHLLEAIKENSLYH